MKFLKRLLYSRIAGAGPGAEAGLRPRDIRFQAIETIARRLMVSLLLLTDSIVER